MSAYTTPAEMTPAEMARTPHRRCEVGFTAVTERGEVFIYVHHLKVWVCMAPLLRKVDPPCP